MAQIQPGELPKVRGRYSRNADMSRITWFQVGGSADILFKPADTEDLQHFLSCKPAHIPVYIFGVGSNILIRDGGIRGVVIRLGRAFAAIEIDATEITAGAAALDVNVAKTAVKQHLSGLEFLSGIPGTIGGALRMNAGAYGREICDVLIEAQALDGQGKKHILSRDDMKFSYRHSAIPEDWIFIAAKMHTRPGDHAKILTRMEDIKTARMKSQPIGSRTGGSTFKNPRGMSAWKLIDEAGCRGLSHGGAMLSRQHCNFLINTGNASARDLETLGENIRQCVREKHGKNLEWEIRRIGDYGDE